MIILLVFYFYKPQTPQLIYSNLRTTESQMRFMVVLCNGTKNNFVVGFFIKISLYPSLTKCRVI